MPKDLFIPTDPILYLVHVFIVVFLNNNHLVKRTENHYLNVM